MKFSAALYAAAFVTCAMASPITEPRTTDAAADDELIVTIKDYEFTEDSKLVPRLNTQSANNVGYGKAIAAAVDAAYTQAKQIANWDKSREAFTKGTTQFMAQKNPDWNRAKAAVCYNQGYRIRDPSNYYGLQSVSISKGVLKTDYDCFYLGNGNAFIYEGGDGGFVNLAMNYPTDYCTWDRGLALTCMP